MPEVIHRMLMTAIGAMIAIRFQHQEGNHGDDIVIV